MKYVQFDYVNKFSCLAGKCPDTCCKDWQIILDEDAIARYASLPGELGNSQKTFLSKRKTSGIIGKRLECKRDISACQRFYQ